MRRSARVAARAVVLAAAGLVLVAGPAAADPPAPGDYTSTVTSIEPDTGAFEIEVFGGDSFLHLEATGDAEVVVLGYEGEPYLRFRPEGGVDRNRRSTATYLNDDRYARGEIPPELHGVDLAELEPDWERVASGREYAWHDHRIHWMAPNSPPGVPRGGTFGWNGPVELLVDGQPVEVHGSIAFHEDVSPLPWLAAGVVVAVGVGIAARRWPGRGWALLALAVAGGAAWVSWSMVADAPSGTGVSSVPLWMVVASAVLAAGAALGPPRLRPVALLASATVVASWAVFRFDVLTNPILPTPLPFAVDRAVTVAGMAVGLALVPAAFGQLSARLDQQERRDDPRVA